MKDIEHLFWYQDGKLMHETCKGIFETSNRIEEIELHIDTTMWNLATYGNTDSWYITEDKHDAEAGRMIRVEDSDVEKVIPSEVLLLLSIVR